MNSRIKELMVEAGYAAPQLALRAQKLAELIVLECMYVGRLAQINNQLVDSEIKAHFGVE